jgi:hypothetical protein
MASRETRSGPEASAPTPEKPPSTHAHGTTPKRDANDQPQPHHSQASSRARTTHRSRSTHDPNHEKRAASSDAPASEPAKHRRAKCFSKPTDFQHGRGKIEARGKKRQKCIGGAGYRSPYLSHAKRALYHLSYTPLQAELLDLMMLQGKLLVHKASVHCLGEGGGRSTLCGRPRWRWQVPVPARHSGGGAERENNLEGGTAAPQRARASRHEPRALLRARAPGSSVSTRLLCRSAARLQRVRRSRRGWGTTTTTIDTP